MSSEIPCLFAVKFRNFFLKQKQSVCEKIFVNDGQMGGRQGMALLHVLAYCMLLWLR